MPIDEEHGFSLKRPVCNVLPHPPNVPPNVRLVQPPNLPPSVDARHLLDNVLDVHDRIVVASISGNAWKHRSVVGARTIAMHRSLHAITFDRSDVRTVDVTAKQEKGGAPGESAREEASAKAVVGAAA